MQHIIISSISIAAVYGLYWALLRKDTDFRQLRFFMLIGVLLSVLLPFSSASIELSFLQEEEAQKMVYLPVTTAALPQLPAAEQPTVNWWALLFKLYLIVVSAMLLRLAVQFFVLLLIYRTSVRLPRKGFTLVVNRRFKTAFTFFRWVFVHEDTYREKDFDTILAHERIHALQNHSLDLILMEIVVAYLWFNPWAWQTRKALQLIHEYLADEGALSTGVDRYTYQALLINQVAEGRLIRLASSFNHSLIKKRMIMMTKSKTNRSTKLKKMVLLPFALVLFLAVAASNTAFGQQKEKEGQKEKKVKVTHRTTTEDETINGDAKRHEIKVEYIVNDSDKSDQIVVEEQGNAKATGNAVVVVAHSANTRTIYIDDNDFSTDTFIVQNGKNENVKIKEYHSDDDSTQNIFVVKRQKIIDDGEVIVNVDMHKTDDHAVIIKKEAKKIELRTGEDDKDILYIIDGKKTKDAQKVKELDPNQIESINVIKDGELKKYTKKKVDAVIIITTKKSEPAVRWIGNDENILYIIDGKETTDAEVLQKIDPEEIEKIEVFKKKSAIKKLTKQKVESVIKVTTK